MDTSTLFGNDLAVPHTSLVTIRAAPSKIRKLQGDFAIDPCPKSSLITDIAETIDLQTLGVVDAEVDSGSSQSRELTPPGFFKRKSHRKSRNGCLICKKRKVKCQETRPSCANCTQRGLRCVYVSEAEVASLVRRGQIVAKPQQVVQLQSTPTTFSLSDMRLFHHFIIKSYPHLPLGNDETWTCDIPAFAHHYDYLMHAMLSVAASHLTLFSTSELSEVALTHRGLAIAGLNKAMSRSPECSSDADAMMAACYALSFQSSYTDDGLMDFLIFIRGCSLISFTAFQNPAESVFRDNTTEGHMQIMRPKLMTAPTVDPFLASTASDAVDSIRHLCSHKIEWEFHQLLVDITHSLLETSQQAYIRLLAIYGICGSMSNEDFEHFSNPENHVCQILLAHFLAIQSILAPLTNLELEGRGRQAPAKARVPWVDRIAQMTPQSQRVYLTWPLEVANAVRSELEVAATSSGLNESLILRKTQGCYSYLI